MAVAAASAGVGDRAASRDDSGVSALAKRFQATRDQSLALASPLSAEDQCVQAMDDASPTKWNLGHTSWFFEELILKPFAPGYKIFDPTFAYLFNSYYESLGPRQPRPKRGLLTRPGLDEVRAYRAHVDAAMAGLLASGDFPEDVLTLTELGINHEQQHQELLLSDILSLFAANPLRPAYYRARDNGTAASGAVAAAPITWHDFAGGICAIGHEGEGFAYDNEGPRHEVLIHPFRLAHRLITNGEWLDFIADGGYRTASLWLADGWAMVNKEGWRAPLYWQEQDGVWQQMTLEGLVPVAPDRPVCHISFYEAQAFALWAGKRLPSEFEWELAAANVALDGNMLGAGLLQPAPARGDGSALCQMFGDVWEWTASAYAPYPRFRPATGAVGEYNGKFMCGQYVLKGGSFATPEGHIRRSYRNFFYPYQQWQFMGLRLAEDC